VIIFFLYFVRKKTTAASYQLKQALFSFVSAFVVGLGEKILKANFEK